MKSFTKALIVLSFFGIMSTQASADPGDAAEESNIHGRVVDDTDQTLPCATIYIEELKMGVTSDINGYYTLPHLKAGTYTVVASYVGYAPATYKVTVVDGKTAEQDIVMSQGVELEEVNVSGAFTGQRRAINMQKNSVGISNVVSADQVGKFPDSNIGDALKRIQGINVQYDQGEARFGQVRGTSADLTSVTVNGNRIPSAEGDTRNVQLDLIPADMIQTIEVNKVVTSDMDGDAIGGAINLVTKQSPYRQMFNVTVGSGYNWISDKPQWNLGMTYGDRFFSGVMGLMVAASYQYNPAGSDDTEFEYEENEDDDTGETTIDLKEAQVRQYYVTRQRQSYSLSLDFKFNADHTIAFKGIYNHRNDWENRYRVSYKKLTSKASKQSLVLQTKGGDSDNKCARLERQQTMDFTLDGQHHFGILAVDWAASFSHAEEDRPEERYMAIKLSGDEADEDGLAGYFVGQGGKHPYSTMAIPSIDDYDWELDELTNQNQEINEDEWKFRLNIEIPLLKGEYGNKLKIGGKYTSKEKDKEIHCFDYVDAYEEAFGDAWKQNMTSQIRKDYMPGSQYPIGTPFISKSYLGHMDFDALEGEELLEEASGNYDAEEKIISGYLRFDQQLGERLSAVVGLRIENTDLTYSGYNWVVDEDENESLEATGDVSNDYTNVLPSVLLKFSPNDDSNIRASFTQTLSRPKYSALIPCVSYSIADEEATIGNPTLDPTTSSNFDLGGEYFFKSVGLVSLGFFYKNVKDVIVDEVWKGTSDELPVSGDYEYEITKTINAYDADIFGIEVALQRDLGFIAPALKCIGVYGNYTYTHSSTKNYNFTHRELEDGEDITMTGSPEHTANASIVYENKGLSVRLSYNFASDFIDEMGESAALDRYYDKVNYLDLNASYTLGQKVKTTIYAEATNMLNQPLRYYQGEGCEDRTMQSEYYGVRLNFGVKVNF